MCRRNCEYRSGKRTGGQGINDMTCAYHNYGPGWKCRTTVLIETLKKEGIDNPERLVLDEMLKAENCLFYLPRKKEKRPSTRPQQEQPPLKQKPDRKRKKERKKQPRLCEICGRDIANKAANARYCDDCADRKREEYTTIRNKEKYRKKKMRESV